MKYLNHSEGYLMVKKPKSLLADKRGYVFEHRFIMQDELLKYENPTSMRVHHIDGNRKNNRKENLMIVDEPTHRKLENGWILKDKKWLKICSGCKNLIEVNEVNFYYRKSGLKRRIGTPFYICKKCCKDLHEQKKGVIKLP